MLEIFGHFVPHDGSKLSEVPYSGMEGWPSRSGDCPHVLFFAQQASQPHPGAKGRTPNQEQRYQAEQSV
jgi:hypothetical protein